MEDKVNLLPLLSSVSIASLDLVILVALEAVGMFVQNLSSLSTAVDELMKLTVNAKDELSSCPQVGEAMEMISKGAALLHRSDMGRELWFKCG